MNNPQVDQIRLENKDIIKLRKARGAMHKALKFLNIVPNINLVLPPNFKDIIPKKPINLTQDEIVRSYNQIPIAITYIEQAKLISGNLENYALHVEQFLLKSRGSSKEFNILIGEEKEIIDFCKKIVTHLNKIETKLRNIVPLYQELKPGLLDIKNTNYIYILKSLFLSAKILSNLDLHFGKLKTWEMQIGIRSKRSRR
jgi:hypothetical protein